MEGTERLEMVFLGKDRYMIPTYQRGYSWETEHVTELLQDLEYAHDAENEIYEHFFGTVLITNPKMPSDNMIKVIDGQQRLTTVVVFLVCVRNFFLAHEEDLAVPDAKKHRERLEEYLYKGEKSPVLVLSRTNKKLFEEIMEPRTFAEALPGTHSESNDSNELLTHAYKIIRSWVGEKDTGDIELTVKTLYSYVRTLFEKFVIYKYHYNDEAKAYAVFNLVNNRGTNLNESDLIKNYLFGEMASRGMKDEGLDSCDERWDEMRRNATDKKKADYMLDRFFYHYLLTFYGDKIPKNKKIESGALHLKQKEIHNTFRSLVKNKIVEPKMIIKDMERWSDILNQLRNPSANVFSRSHILHYLEKIKDVKAVFVYPAILAGYKEYWLKKDYDQFEALVMMCFKYHVRVKVIGTSMSVSSYQDIMYKITDKINRGVMIKTIITELMKKEDEYPADERVLQNLLEQRVSNSKLAIALLEEVEYGYNEERSSLATVSVEHIMPKSFEAWKSYIERYNTTGLKPAEFHDQYFSLLGNQTLLSRKKNTAASNRSFNEKQKDYYAKENTYRITRALAANDIKIWNGKAIRDRQEKLAKKLLQVIDLSSVVDECRL